MLFGRQKQIACVHLMYLCICALSVTLIVNIIFIEIVTGLQIHSSQKFVCDCSSIV